jgi:hypothetical protein
MIHAASRQGEESARWVKVGGGRGGKGDREGVKVKEGEDERGEVRMGG